MTRLDRGAARPRVAVLVAMALVCPASAAPVGERLIHAEDFSRAAEFDASFWAAETGFFRNKEAQYYQPANVSVEGGALVLEARRETATNAAYDANGRDWLTTTRSAGFTSGSIVSREAFTYGVFEVVARLPQGAGAWPAIWTVFEQGLPYREIDLVEAVGASPGRVWSTVHAGRNLDSLKTWQTETPMPDLASAFHAYKLDWRRDAIVLSIDGRQVLRMNPEEAHQGDIDPLRAPMRLRINLALGGSWGGPVDEAALPARMEIKSIKVWSVDP